MSCWLIIVSEITTAHSKLTLVASVLATRATVSQASATTCKLLLWSWNKPRAISLATLLPTWGAASRKLVSCTTFRRASRDHGPLGANEDTCDLNRTPSSLMGWDVVVALNSRRMRTGGVALKLTMYSPRVDTWTWSRWCGYRELPHQDCKGLKDCWHAVLTVNMLPSWSQTIPQSKVWNGWGASGAQSCPRPRLKNEFPNVLNHVWKRTLLFFPNSQTILAFNSNSSQQKKGNLSYFWQILQNSFPHLEYPKVLIWERVRPAKNVSNNSGEILDFAFWPLGTASRVRHGHFYILNGI